MKTLWLIVMSAALMLPSTSYSECEIIEAEGKIEVVCEGEATIKQNSSQSSRSVRKRSESDVYIDARSESSSEDYERPKKAKKSKKAKVESGSRVSLESQRNRSEIPTNTEIKIYGISVIGNVDTKDATHVHLNIKCDVESNIQAKNFTVTISGISREGNDVLNITLNKGITAGQMSVLTGTATVAAQKYYDVRIWEVRKVKIYEVTYAVTVKDDDRYPEYYMNSDSAIIEVSPGYGNTTSDTVIDYQYNSSGASVIDMKSGVKFTHENHQKKYRCSYCHANASGRIEGFGKDWAHNKCEGCHKRISIDISCRICHKSDVRNIEELHRRR